MTADSVKRYERIKLFFFFLETALSLAVVSVFALAGPSSWLASALQPSLGKGYAAAWAFTTLCLLGYSLLFLPLDYARGYVVEHRFALSTQSRAAWALDVLKGFVLKWALTSLFAVMLLFLLLHAGEAWWIWAGIFWLAFGIVLSQLFPVLILPLFYKIAPLENEALKARLMQMASNVRAKIVGIYQFDMSRKTKKANAMFTGLGRTKRIILGDTLLSKFQDDEIEVILAHEMGHYVHKHIAKQVAASALLTFLGLWLVHHMLAAYAAAQGYDGVGHIALLPLIGLLLSVLAFLAMPLGNGYSRHCERQADSFALRQTRNADAFRRGMEKLAEQNLANKNPHPALEFFLYSHPSIAKRIRMADAFAARAAQS